MVLKPKLTRHSKSCAVCSHEHTSYGPLVVLLVVVGVILGFFTADAAEHPVPGAGSIGLTGTVPGKPPTTGAKITKPTAGQRFATMPVTVEGTCPKDTLVEIFKNDIFAGSTVCSENETFSLQIDLMNGENKLIARVYDALNQPGPSSEAITVYNDALPAQMGPLSSLDFGGTQLLLNTDAVFRGIFPKQDLYIPIDIIGGRAPYAITIQWGDNTNKVVPRNDNVSFKVSHAYNKPGVYQVTIQGTDADGRLAFLTVAAIVNGQPDPVATTTDSTNTTAGTIGKMLALWPMYIAALAVVISFWLGERRERRVLQAKGLLVA